MQAILSVAAVKAAEQRWAESAEGETWPLMLKAGQAVARHARRHWPSAQRVLVLAGRGNNGGDGYVAASCLMDAGLEVAVLAPAGTPRAHSDADRAYHAYQQQGGRLVENPDRLDADLIIDAVIGTGHQGALKAPWPALFSRLNSSGIPVLAVDVPSGLEAATGRADSEALVASRTLSFIAHKVGLLTGDGPALVGKLALERLGVDPGSEVLGHYLNTAPAWPERPANGHKGRFGQVAVLAGAPGFGGAGLLAARAALAAGAGRVVWHTEGSNVAAALAAQPELMTAALDAPPQGTVVLGPGLGLEQQAEALYRRTLDSVAAGVLDADGLSWLARQPRPMPGWVLTPHPGEAARLLECSSTDIQADRCRAAQALAERYQATVVLKGSGTLVAEGDQLRVVHAGTPAMATPGMGDTLAGLIAALLAQGQTPWQAAQTGAWWHAFLAAERARTHRVVLASDLIAALQRGPQLSG